MYNLTNKDYYIMKKAFITLLIFAFVSHIFAQDQNGKLFIIGGGKRPPSLVQELIRTSNIDKDDYIVVLPMSSSEPDTSFFYAKKQFVEQDFKNVVNFNFTPNNQPGTWIDSLKKATLIYISGGDQNKFMDIVLGTEIHDAIKTAYQNGATIAGTSAGAAVMSKKMITGNEFKYPEYTGEFRTIEANNIEIKEGLGLLENCIVDQHFIWRMRMNRLITTSIENPNYACIGIDESTAIIVSGDSAKVVGESQVVVLKNENKGHFNDKELLGIENINLSVYLPGEKFLLDIE